MRTAGIGDTARSAFWKGGRNVTTVQEVFDAAIHLMDEQNESSGATETQDTTPYKVRTINILNVIIP